MKLKELEVRKAGLLSQVETLNAEAQKDTTDLVALGDNLTALEADLTKVNKEIAALERLDKLSAQSTAFTGGEPRQGRGATSGQGAVIKDLNGGFADMADFAMAVRGAYTPNGTKDARLTELMATSPTNFHREVGSPDGALVPVGMAQKVWDLVYGGGENLLNLFNLEPTSVNMVPIITDETTAYGASGVQASWESEGNQLTPSRLATNTDFVQVHKLYAFVTATEELIADAPRLANRITTKAAAAIQYRASDSLLNGNGTGRPLGILNAGALVTQAIEAGQTAATINTPNVSKMYSRLLEEGGGNGSFWLGNRDIFPQLPALVVGQQPVWQQNFREAPGGALFGLPLYFFEGCQTLGTAGDFFLINPSGYAGFLRQGLSYAESMHLFFDYGINAFRWTFRMGGQPYLTAPVAAAKGNTTKSHFVALATRA